MPPIRLVTGLRAALGERKATTDRPATTVARDSTPAHWRSAPRCFEASAAPKSNTERKIAGGPALGISATRRGVRGLNTTDATQSHSVHVPLTRGSLNGQPLPAVRLSETLTVRPTLPDQ
jgi:hypothetical protein